MNTPVLMTEEYWASSPFSIARYYGRITVRGVEYVIVNKEGKDIFQFSIEAEKAGRAKAIEPGEPADLIDRRYITLYREAGRVRFIGWLKEGLTMKEMEERLRLENH